MGHCWPISLDEEADKGAVVASDGIRVESVTHAQTAACSLARTCITDETRERTTPSLLDGCHGGVHIYLCCTCAASKIVDCREVLCNAYRGLYFHSCMYVSMPGFSNDHALETFARKYTENKSTECSQTNSQANKILGASGTPSRHGNTNHPDPLLSKQDVSPPETLPGWMPLPFDIIGRLGVGWQRHCKTCCSIRDLDNQDTLFSFYFFVFFGGLPQVVVVLDHLGEVDVYSAQQGN